jgi:TIR domain/Dynamin family
MIEVEKPTVFISYRRDDTQDIADRLYDFLALRLGEEHVFMDVDSIEYGLDFEEALEDRLNACAAVLALIGPRWLTEADSAGGRRLDNPEDYVRRELEAGLRRPGVRVIPVLVHGAKMPDRSELPESLAPLSKRQGLPLSREFFREGVARLIDRIEKLDALPRRDTKVDSTDTVLTASDSARPEEQAARDSKPAATPIKDATMSCVRQLLETGARYGLQPPVDIHEYRSKREHTSHRVLLVGERGRGRRSIINALIGREIIPVDADSSGGQALVVKHSELEDYRIRFEDGSTRQLGADELTRCLSLNQNDIVGAASAGTSQPIRWIELDLPARYLQKDVEIVYLPPPPQAGDQRAAMVRRFAPLADAVTFVLDSCRPIDRAESSFIGEILAQTPDIFFIQTKIDQYPEEWEQVLRRNQEILKEQFDDRLASATIWPISSKRLLHAASAEDAGALRRSRFEDMEHGLRDFLTRLDVTLCAKAIRAATAYHRAGCAALSERVDSATGDDGRLQPQADRLAAWDRLGHQIRETAALVEREASRIAATASSPAGPVTAPA